MRELNDANESNPNTGDVINVDEKLKKELDSNKSPVKISATIDSESIAEEEETSASQKQQNICFEKETELCEIIENIHQSFNAFQKTMVDTDKDAFLNDDSHDHPFIIERSPTLCTSGNLLQNTSEPITHVITETTERNHDVDKEVTFLHNTFNDYISIKESLPTLYTSGNMLPNTSEPRIHVITETNEMDVKEIETTSTRASPTMEYSTSGSIIPKCENLPPISNSRFHKSEMHCDVFKEDDDWDIYQLGFETNGNTESLQESRFSFERLKNEYAEHFTKNNSINSVDYVSCQSVSPYTERGTRCSPFNNSVNNRDVFTERIVKRMLKEVKEFFLNNPVDITSNLDDLEREAWIITSPFFSRDFAKKHGQLPLPTFTPIQGLNFPKDPAKARRLLLGYELIMDLEISEDDFFRYISIYNQGHARKSPGQGYNQSESNPLIEELNHIQEQVGTDIFSMIYEQLRTDERYQTLFRSKELLFDTVLFWYAYNEKRMELLREKYKNTRSNFMSQNQ